VPGAPQGYAEYLPPGYGAGAAVPLLIFLHGVGSNGDGTASQLGRVLELGIPPLIEHDAWPASRPFIVLMPQHDSATGSNCPAATEVDTFMKFALGHYQVDRSRIYLTGLSCGAIGGWDYLAAHTNQIVAAAVLISGRADHAFAQAGCRLGRVPVWAFHGAKDPVVPLSSITRPVNALRACIPAPVDLHLTIYPNAGHDVWTRTYNLSAGHDVYAWLLRHRHA
jgi:predicted peptidase